MSAYWIMIIAIVQGKKEFPIDAVRHQNDICLPSIDPHPFKTQARTSQ
jgi:hypothetical protein